MNLVANEASEEYHATRCAAKMFGSQHSSFTCCDEIFAQNCGVVPSSPENCRHQYHDLCAWFATRKSASPPWHIVMKGPLLREKFASKRTAKRAYIWPMNKNDIYGYALVHSDAVNLSIKCASQLGM